MFKKGDKVTLVSGEYGLSQVGWAGTVNKVSWGAVYVDFYDYSDFPLTVDAKDLVLTENCNLKYHTYNPLNEPDLKNEN